MWLFSMQNISEGAIIYMTQQLSHNTFLLLQFNVLFGSVSAAETTQLIKERMRMSPWHSFDRECCCFQRMLLNAAISQCTNESRRESYLLEIGLRRFGKVKYELPTPDYASTWKKIEELRYNFFSLWLCTLWQQFSLFGIQQCGKGYKDLCVLAP